MGRLSFRLPRRPATLTLGRLGTAPFKKPASCDAGFLNGAVGGYHSGIRHEPQSIADC